MLYYFSGPLAPAVGRASVILFLGIADLVASGMASYKGLIGVETVTRTGIALLPMVLATWAGALVFKRADPERFRQWVIIVLAALSVVSLGRAVAAMLG